MNKLFISLLITITYCCSLYADVTVPHIFGNCMVLQRKKVIPVWGWATVNEKVTVSFNHQTKTTVTDRNGKWTLNLDKEAAGGPFQLVIKGNNTLVFKDVLVGEVWICSGQSNMEMPIAGWGKINNYEQEIAQANYPMIRHIKVPKNINTAPIDDILPADWRVCNPLNAGEFSAVGYFFARELYNKLKVPVGLINTSWGGTHIETWTSRQAFENSAEYRAMIADMPTINLDSLIKVKKEASTKNLEAIQGPMTNLDPETWKDPNTDFSNWPHMPLPNLWETQQLKDVDGIVWFRKTVTISAKEAGESATLELAMIDDNDSTYVNGVLAGRTNGYNVKRKYIIPAGVLKEGKNVIAVRVEDTGGNGGIYGEPGDMKLTAGDRSIPLAGNWYFKVERITGDAGSIGPNSYPTLLFNAMINPLIPFAFKGVIWYQGESNAERAHQYQKAFPLMITDWRKRWNQGEFPFYFVQLASFNAGGGNSQVGSKWAELREAQMKSLLLPNTGMAVTTDIGDSLDIHPKDKQDVGKRLAAIALHNLYGQTNEFTGPMYQSKKTDGNKVTIRFTGIGNGLIVKENNGLVKGFEVGGADKHFYIAKAEIQGNTIVVYSEKVMAPVAVRYGWKDYAANANLYNKAGFPASPFRSDKWKGVTEGVKFELRPLYAVYR